MIILSIIIIGTSMAVTSMLIIDYASNFVIDINLKTKPIMLTVKTVVGATAITGIALIIVMHLLHTTNSELRELKEGLSEFGIPATIAYSKVIELTGVDYGQTAILKVPSFAEPLWKSSNIEIPIPVDGSVDVNVVGYAVGRVIIRTRDHKAPILVNPKVIELTTDYQHPDQTLVMHEGKEKPLWPQNEWRTGPRLSLQDRWSDSSKTYSTGE